MLAPKFCRSAALLEFFEKVQDSPIFILYSLIGLLWTLARDFFKTRTKNTLRLAGLKAKVYTFMLYGMWKLFHGTFLDF